MLDKRKSSPTLPRLPAYALKQPLSDPFLVLLHYLLLIALLQI
jgi:hypothetical protein